MFARMEVLLPDEHPVLVIPATSILRAPYGDSSLCVGTVNQLPPAAWSYASSSSASGRAWGDFVSVESRIEGRRSGGDFRHFQTAQRHECRREQQPYARFGKETQPLG